jgi:hypothetical protein
MLDYVVHDIGWGIVDTSRLADLRLLLDLRSVATLGQTDHLTEELFINLSENVYRQHCEFIGALRVVQAPDNPTY